MDVAGALADLLEVSSPVDDAVVLDRAGTLLGSTRDDAERSAAIAAAARRILDAGAAVRDGEMLTQVVVTTRRGRFFVVRDDARLVAATAAVTAPIGLVVYDMATCLRALSASTDGDAAAA